MHDFAELLTLSHNETSAQEYIREAQKLADNIESKAAALLRMMHPHIHTQTTNESIHYKVEPYVVVADIYDLPGHVGRGGWSWYTGAAGWMYRIWLEEVLGFKLRGQTLKIDCAMPTEWKEYKIRYAYKSSSYEIVVKNHGKPHEKKVTVDGVEQESHEIALQDDRKNHDVLVTV